ncbi:hypothetical protein MIMGU_mgv11b024381mg [Erythranthe guttata]|uniref:Uncharacterized protein n=1 Tax=Erythranthe guttata TaxID=4155 RepID=A0A022RG50_ERYGU|nr:hypothetical protein MIMGU_mgv11b024381mg [Erythranthe guttata]
MRIKVLVLYFVFLRTLLGMHFRACFFTCLFVHVHLSECVCACLLICINVLGLKFVFPKPFLRMQFCASNSAQDFALLLMGVFI